VYVGKTLFAQVMEFVPWTSFARIVQRHGGNAGVRSLSCAEQLRAMAFAQLSWRESLRDIEASLSANSAKRYAMGFRSAVKRSTLADANESRDWRIWADLAAVLIRRARKLHASESLGVELDNTVYALDSSTVDLCLSLFDWAPFRSTKAAIKLHTLLDWTWAPERTCLKGPDPSPCATRRRPRALASRCALRPRSASGASGHPARRAARRRSAPARCCPARRR